VVLAWEEYDTVALDSPGVIQKIWSVQFRSPRSWIGGALKSQVIARLRKMMRVRGHQDIVSNERADLRAKGEVEMGARMLRPDIATPAGIGPGHDLARGFTKESRAGSGFHCTQAPMTRHRGEQEPGWENLRYCHLHEATVSSSAVYYFRYHDPFVLMKCGTSATM